MPGVKRQKASLERKRSYAGYLFILPFIIGLFVIFLPMIIQLFLMSFSVFNSADSTFSYGAAGFGYYKEIFTKDSWFLQLYTSTISKSLIDSVCILLFSYFVAILLKQKFRGRAAARTIFFLPVVLVAGIVGKIDSGNLATSISGIQSSVDVGVQAGITLPNVTDILSSKNIISSDLLNIVIAVVDRLGVMVTSSGVQILLFLAGLYSISESIYESAAIEGCSGWEMYWKITLPITSPMILLNSVYTVIDTFTNTNNSLIAALLNMTNNQKFPEAASRSVIYLLVVGILVALIFLFGRKFVYYRE